MKNVYSTLLKVFYLFLLCQIYGICVVVCAHVTRIHRSASLGLRPLNLSLPHSYIAFFYQRTQLPNMSTGRLAQACAYCNRKKVSLSLLLVDLSAYHPN